jgi:hypothetical protein
MIWLTQLSEDLAAFSPRRGGPEPITVRKGFIGAVVLGADFPMDCARRDPPDYE